MAERMTQAEWDANRKAVKAKAAKTVKENAAKAKAQRDKVKGIQPESKSTETKAAKAAKAEDKGSDKK